MKNYAGHRLSPWLGHLMVSRQETARPLLTAGEIMQLPPTDELVLVSGVPPIRAKKARYYEDRRLSARILPPPTMGQGRPQRPARFANQPPVPSQVPPIASGSAAVSGKAKKGHRANAGIRREPELPLQSGIGIVIEQWTPEGGRYPTVAYQTAFAFIIALQIAALLWFIRPNGGVHVVFTREIRKIGSDPRAQTGQSLGFHKAAYASVDPLATARSEALRWRRVAFAAGALSMALAIILVVSAGHAGAMLHGAAVERLATADASAQAGRYVQASDSQIAYTLSRFIEDVRSLSTDPIVVRSRWARAFEMVTDQGAQTLNAFAGDAGLTRIGKKAVIAD